MTEEFNLSDNELTDTKYSSVYLYNDIKKFIKRLKEDIIEHRNIAQYKHPQREIIVALSNEIINIIEKRAGDKLI